MKQLFYPSNLLKIRIIAIKYIVCFFKKHLLKLRSVLKWSERSVKRT
jgi:hypothetical protein